MLTAAENVTAVGSVAVLIGPSAAIVVTSPPAAAPVPKVEVRREATPLGPVGKEVMAYGARMTADPTAAVTVRRFRASSGHGGRAKGYSGSKTKELFSHAVCTSSLIAGK